MSQRTRMACAAACALLVTATLTIAIAVTRGPDQSVSWLDARSKSAPLPGQTTGSTEDPSRPADPVGKATPPPPPAGAIPIDAAIKELRGEDGKPSFMVRSPTGAVRAVTAGRGESLAADPKAFVRRYAAAFGLTRSHTVTATGESTMPGGDTVTRFQQRAGGLPVIGAEIVVSAGGDGVRGAVAKTSPLSPVATTATVARDVAESTALAAVVKAYSIDAATITGADAALWLYDPTVIGAPGASQLRPTYWVRLTGANGGEIASALVDAADGSVRLTAIERETIGQRRVVCDLNNAQVNLAVLTAYLCNGTAGALPAARSEGGAVSSVAEVNSAYDRLGAAYAFFKNTFGRDSYDGRGGQIRATLRACDSFLPVQFCPYPNAFWDGYQLVFGQGYATDDVVGHEFSHAVTEHASSLVYWYQSGAINEALSDIFGQLIDLQTPADDAGANRWLLGEDLPGGAIRSMNNPPAFGQPQQYAFDTQDLWDFDPQQLDNGGVHTNSGVANKAAYLIADGTANEPGGEFRGIHITGIGLSKSAQLWYRVQSLLPSGANYEELGAILPSACYELVGHFSFTIDDCEQIDLAARVTGMQVPQDSQGHGAAEAPYCVHDANEPPLDLFSDDMERPSTKWVFSNPTSWQRIPSRTANFSYAATGRGSINGWTQPGVNGNGSFLEMAQAVTLPAGKAAYLRFAQSLIKGASQARIDVQISANGGPWTALVSDWAGSPASAGQLLFATTGYGSTRLDLNDYQGQTVKIRFVIDSPSNQLIDFYLDDFRVYYCDKTTSAPPPIYGYHSPAGLALKWLWPAYYETGLNVNSAFHWELTYDPPIPGAPATLPLSPPGIVELTVPQADPNVSYKVTIAARHEDGRLGMPTIIRVSARAPVTCPTAKVSPLVLPGVFAPRAPAAACGSLPPRKPR